MIKMTTIPETVTELQSHLNSFRDELIARIVTAVSKNNGCIGTFYQNIGRHHSEEQTLEEYNNSPIVAICNSTYCAYGGFEGNTVYDLFIRPGCDKVLVTLNGEGGEDFDEPIENVQVEGLLCIVSWLTENDFL